MQARLVDELGKVVRIPATRSGERAVSRVGEIWIRGGTLFPGYSDKGGLLRTDFSSDSFFRTGDVGAWDSLGYITVCDRAKDMVIVGGENVYCAEVESVLADHPAVAQVAVFGVPNDVLGELVAGALCTSLAFICGLRALSWSRSQLRLFSGKGSARAAPSWLPGVGVACLHTRCLTHFHLLAHSPQPARERF